MKSARSGTPPQSYLDHVFHVLIRGRCCLSKMLLYAQGLDAAEKSTLMRIYELAAEYHDLGKLEDANQDVLKGANKQKALPIPHADAGVAALAREYGGATQLSQLFIYAHHAGLKDLTTLENDGLRNANIQAATDSNLTRLLELHESEVRPAIRRKTAPPPMLNSLAPLDVRAIFGCLTHADHGDAARADGEPPAPRPPKLRATERLAALRAHVGGLAADADDDERNQLRGAFFAACEAADHGAPITYCDAPVGTGKTTAVMAHLLKSAAKQKLRRVFVILPTTNIITQSVQTYRKALKLPDENSEQMKQVVAEVHHRADFDDPASRRLTALWDAPIVVTTAVAFFETLASASPSSLRRLQNLPGSAVFLDEAHAMLPIKLLPLAWRWICHAADAWSCRWVLASGSLFKFWELEEFRQVVPAAATVPNLAPTSTARTLGAFERQRVTYRNKNEMLTISDMVKWLATLTGPIIAVFNTVHTAAAVAQAAAAVFGSANVLHISTALTPADRDQILKQVRKRLKDEETRRRLRLNDIPDNCWCLIATSCVEAGMDFSFRNGARENASLLSTLQLGGRVNRNAEHPDAEVWTFKLNPADDDVIRNPAFTAAAGILEKIFIEGQTLSPELCTDVFRHELRETATDLEKLAGMEDCFAFKSVEENFRVISDNARPVLIDKELVAKVKNWEEISWRDIQRNSVNMREKLRQTLALEESKRYPGLWLWPEGCEYSPFIGYMAAVLKQGTIDKNGCAIV